MPTYLQVLSTLRFYIASLLACTVAISCGTPEEIEKSDHSHELPNTNYGTAAHNPTPTSIPDRIILTWKTDPATSQAVTWRTDTTVVNPTVEIAPAESSPKFNLKMQKVAAQTEPVTTESGSALYHSANLTGLTSNTIYAYRVGGGEIWSEWFQFRTATSEPSPFTFVYFGDAQNNLLSLWSRVIRQAYSDAPKASFLLHAGDLVNRAERDVEWGEWFDAGDWIHAMVPSVPSPGNHEYTKDAEGKRAISRLWRPHFTLPENGLPGLEESVYYFDYQGARIISLNSMERTGEQAKWLENVLKDNPNRWTFVTLHYPIFSTKEGRDNKTLRDLLKPIFDKYGVDLVLTGHDHTYGRGQNLPKGAGIKVGGTVYVVSVSGPKMYKLDPTPWWNRGAENTQLFQVISVDGNRLKYEALTATGELYDAFDLVKSADGTNKMIDLTPSTPGRRHSNTIGGRE
jgi:hypothetical protein